MDMCRKTNFAICPRSLVCDYFFLLPIMEEVKQMLIKMFFFSELKLKKFPHGDCVDVAVLIHSVTQPEFICINLCCHCPGCLGTAVQSQCLSSDTRSSIILHRNSATLYFYIRSDLFLDYRVSGKHGFVEHCLVYSHLPQLQWNAEHC